MSTGNDSAGQVIGSLLDKLQRIEPSVPGDKEYLSGDGLIHCSVCNKPKQVRLKLMGRESVVRCICKCEQEAQEREKKRSEQEEQQRRIARLKANGIQEKHLLEWRFDVADDSPDIQAAHRYVDNWQKVKAENLGLLLWGDVGTGKSFMAACIANALLEKGVPVLMTTFRRF